MKTILCFARLRLTELYIELYKQLNNEYNFVFVAYSKDEEMLIRSQLSNVKIINFTDLVNERISTTTLNMDTLKSIDELIYELSNQRFTLNSSIQSDRGFAFLSYRDSLLLSQIYYLIWKDIIIENKIDFFLHEFVSLCMNHIASILCKQNNAIYIAEMAVKGFNDYDIMFMNYDEGIPIQLTYEYNKISRENVLINKDLIDNYISLFNNDNKVYFEHLNTKRVDFFKMLLSAFKNEFLVHLGKVDKLKNNIDYFMTHNRVALKKVINIMMYKVFVKWDKYDSSQKYYYYSMHLEPEAVVNYMADGLYKNQIKLIENLAAQLPVGTYLYVKDHPHDIGYRSYIDYLKLKKIPNIKLLDTKIPGSLVIKNCLGVISLNGTAGLEGMMQGKKVFTFGKAFYNISPLSIYVKNIKDFKKAIEKEGLDFNNKKYELQKFSLALLNCLYQGNTDCFYNAKNNLSQNKDNIDAIVNSYRKYLNKISIIVK